MDEIDKRVCVLICKFFFFIYVCVCFSRFHHFVCVCVFGFVVGLPDFHTRRGKKRKENKREVGEEEEREKNVHVE